MIQGNSQTSQGGTDMYVGDRFSPKQKMSHEGQVLAYNKQIQQQQYATNIHTGKQSPKGNQQVTRQNIQK